MIGLTLTLVGTYVSGVPFQEKHRVNSIQIGETVNVIAGSIAGELVPQDRVVCPFFLTPTTFEHPDTNSEYPRFI